MVKIPGASTRTSFSPQELSRRSRDRQIDQIFSNTNFPNFQKILTNKFHLLVILCSVILSECGLGRFWANWSYGAFQLDGGSPRIRKKTESGLGPRLLVVDRVGEWFTTTDPGRRKQNWLENIFQLNSINSRKPLNQQSNREK